MTNGSLNFKVEGLVAGAQIQFNIIATNIVGDSPPSETSPMYNVIGESITTDNIIHIVIGESITMCIMLLVSQ